MLYCESSIMFNLFLVQQRVSFITLGECILLGCSQRKLPLDNYKLLVNEYASDPYHCFNLIFFKVSLCALKLIF